MGGAAILVAIVAVALLAAIVVAGVALRGKLNRDATHGDLPGQEGPESRPEHVAVGTEDEQREMRRGDDA